MANRVQIVVMEKGDSRWKFIAHGAAYDRGEAEQFKARREAMGDKVKFLPITKAMEATKRRGY